ncbi:PAS domain S-box protein [Methanobacterium sp.]|uniref:PAS domain S-box protein n=1 Tax=Methanobacterium sp. TaxID=2164 RepID=UPI003C766E44
MKHLNSKYEEIFQSSPIGILFFDKEGKLVDANNSALEIFAVPSLDNIKGANLFDNSIIKSKKDKLVKNGLIKFQTSLNSDYIKKSGFYPPTHIERLFIDYTISITDSGYLVQIQDITHQEDLRSSQQMLENMLENFPGVVFWKDSNSVYLGCNKNFSNGAGLKDPSEIIGKTDYELPWEKTEAEKYRIDDQQVMASEMPKLHIIETQLQSDGNILWFDTNKIPLFDQEHNVIGILGVSNDITQLKEVEQKLRQAQQYLEDQVEERTKELKSANMSLKINEKKFRELFDKANDMITLVELNEDGTYGKFIEVNDITSRKLGYSKKELLNMTLYDITAPECLLDVQKNNEELKNKMHTRFEVVHLTKDGKRIYIENNDHLFEMRGKKVVLAIARDVSLRKSMENEMNELIKELERSNEELQRFAYITSHDLQEPLRTIASFTQLLERRYKGKFDKDADEFMDFIVDAATRMRKMIQDLLEYSRVTTKGGEFKEFNSECVLKQVLDSLKTIIDENNAKITYDSLPIIFADEAQIGRVFQNLISNAIKYKKTDEPPKIHISSIKDDKNNEYIFSISDNGIGIEEQYFDRIFAIFQRLHTREEHEGTGIGLSVVKRIVERHEGRIWVESEHNNGSTFYFSIPVKNEGKLE